MLSRPKGEYQDVFDSATTFGVATFPALPLLAVDLKKGRAYDHHLNDC